MVLDKQRTLFGIHNFTAASRVDGTYFGTIKVLGNMGISGERESIELSGGSNPNAWDVEYGNVNNDISLIIKEFHKMLYTLAGYTVTENVAEAAGAVTALTNKLNATVQDAILGITTVTLESGETANLKDGQYLVKAVTPTTVDVYAVTDIDFRVGTTPVNYQNGLLKITEAPITITTDTGVAIPGIGVELTGGSGTITLVADDTATFEVRSVNLGSTLYTYDQDPIPVEFEAWFFSQKKVNGAYQRLHCPKCTIGTFPYGMNENEWKDSEIVIKVLYDSALGYSKRIFDTIKSAS